MVNDGKKKGHVYTVLDIQEVVSALRCASDGNTDFANLRKLKAMLVQDPPILISPYLRSKIIQEAFGVITYSSHKGRIAKRQLMAIEVLGVIGGSDVRQRLFERLKLEWSCEMSDALQKAIDSIKKE